MFFVCRFQLRHIPKENNCRGKICRMCWPSAHPTTPRRINKLHNKFTFKWQRGLRIDPFGLLSQAAIPRDKHFPQNIQRFFCSYVQLLRLVVTWNHILESFLNSSNLVFQNWSIAHIAKNQWMFWEKCLPLMSSLHEVMLNGQHFRQIFTPAIISIGICHSWNLQTIGQQQRTKSGYSANCGSNDRSSYGKLQQCVAYWERHLEDVIFKT